jgi:DNA-binding NarL/FixJ family response regulator
VDKYRVFLADDHGIMRAGLRALIAACPDMEVVGEASDGLAAVEAIRRMRPDVAILDLNMPILNGAQVAEQLRVACPSVKVVALTVSEDTAYLRLFLEAGVDGYVPKRAAAEDLIVAIRAVAAGGTYLDPVVARKVVHGFVGRPIGGDRPPGDLSEREMEVARLVAEGYTNKEIAARLDVSVKTVETHKKNAMGKLGFRTRADVIRYALRQGWLNEA